LYNLGLIPSSLGCKENPNTKLHGGIARNFFDKRLGKSWENVFFIMEGATL